MQSIYKSAQPLIEGRERHWALALVSAALLLIVATTAAAQTPTYTFTTIDVPGAAATSATGINDAGQIVGIYGSNGWQHSFLISDGNLTPFDVPGATVTLASGINNAGQIVGTFGDGSGGHGFLYSDGNFTPIDVPGATNTGASDISNAGQIIGTFDGYWNSFLYSDGSFTIIIPPLYGWFSDINSAGQIVGSIMYDFYTDYGFLRDVDGSITMIDVPGWDSTDAIGINDVGQIVGGWEGASWLDTGGNFTPIYLPGVSIVSAYKINNAGQIVGAYMDSTGTHGFVAITAQSPGLAQMLGGPSTN